MASTTAQLNEKLLEDILAIYNQAEQDVNKAVAKRLAKGITEKGWAETKQTSVQGFIQEVKAILGNNYKLAQNKAAQGILKAFLGGVNDVELEAGKTKTIMDKLFIPDSIQQLVLTQNDLLNDMNAKVLRGVEDKYRQLQAETSSMVLAGTDTRLDATKRLLNKFSNAGITSFVDKAGRNWNMQSYAEMCVRTNTAHAALQGRIQKQLDLGQDLMKVSSIGTTCPICARWQGVVISITGKSIGFKTLDDARSDGLFHPNCKHTLLMYDEELDGEAKTELNEEGSQYNVAKGADSVERYNLTQQQRANERTIRKLKRQYELALTPQDKATALKKVREAQAKQLQFCDINNLERKYYREGLTKSQAAKMVGPELSKKEKEQEALLKSVLGINPKKEFYMKYNLQFFSEASAIPEYKKFLKDEIKDLNDLTNDKKTMSLTVLYKKYIGDAPAVDYDSVSKFTKGTKEYKNDYAKWLKQQVNGIGTTYGIKPVAMPEKPTPIPTPEPKIETPKKPTPTPIKVAPEDYSLSPTALYKKYMNELPTEAFKAEKGYMDKSEYSKWLNQKAKDLKAGNISKVSAPTPVTDAIPTTPPKDISKAVKDMIDDYGKDAYNELINKGAGAYDAKEALKAALEDLSNATDKVEVLKQQAKVDNIKEYELNAFKKKYSKFAYDNSHDKDLVTGATQKEIDAIEKVIASGKMSPDMVKHLESKKKYLTDIQSDLNSMKLIDFDMKYIKEKNDTDLFSKTQKITNAQLQAKANALVAKANTKKHTAATNTITKLDDAEIAKKVDEITTMDRFKPETEKPHMEKLIEDLRLADGEKIKPYIVEYEQRLAKCNSSIDFEILKTRISNDVRSEKFYNDPELKPIYSLYDYTHASGVYNKVKWGTGASDYTSKADHPLKPKNMKWQQYGEEMCGELDLLFDRISPVEEAYSVKRLLGMDGFTPMLNLPAGASSSQIEKAIDDINAVKGTAIISNSGFTSTSSYSNGSWTGNVGLICKVTKGTRAVYAEGLSHYCNGSELETVLKADQKIRVVKILKRSDDPEGYDEIRKKVGYSNDANKYMIIAETIPDAPE